ncbi:copper transporter family protein [Aspergillus heteromorphus CBS 117.55]|uniref:Copper transport protein n=1 Tax=Aspergillus heteromorphus CBS 117.55 TaxID=1448321 RepID=A0A317WAS7_9EURO|nr:copper transporter family protein [Aspergillus heteromorphus CBS 117.55]PWY83443.1 copper transporter family protein [Aspergillus heteromorphus CBS 117.55]
MATSTSTSMSSMSTSMTMNMVFTNTHTTPLFSTQWTPTTSGSYAGTCVFLIILAILARVLVAFKALMERHWLDAHLNRRYVAVAGKSPEAGRIDTDPEAKVASLVTAQGVEEKVRVVRTVTHAPLPWRFSVDLPRALIFLVITGVSYLLMLAVMTMNVGYFCSVLTGAFLGELAVGRFIQWNEHGH